VLADVGLKPCAVQPLNGVDKIVQHHVTRWTVIGRDKVNIE